MVRAVRLAGYGVLGAALGGLGVAGLASGSWTAAAIGAAVGAAFVVGLTLYSWRRAGGYAMAVAVSRAARTGEVPADADPRTWVPRLERYARNLRQARWLYVVYIVPMLAPLQPGRHPSTLAAAFCVAVIAFDLVMGVDALVRAPGVTRRVEAITTGLALQWRTELGLPA